jgi:uncharacterized tellurite resistance protein B-like protein
MIGRNMFDEIKAWLEGGPTERRSAGAAGVDEVQLAAAALLVEAAHVDADFDPRERVAIDRILERRFKLSPAAARRLLESAEHANDAAAQLFRFTQIINDRFALEQRIELMEMLWEVVYADGTLDALEDTLLRRIGGLINVPDRERGAARQRVVRRLAAGSPTGDTETGAAASGADAAAHIAGRVSK